MINVSQIVKNYAIQATIAPASATPPGFYLLPQAPGEQIVPSTRDVWSAGKGYGLVNEASSQAPISVRFVGRSGSATFLDHRVDRQGAVLDDRDGHVDAHALVGGVQRREVRDEPEPRGDDRREE